MEKWLKVGMKKVAFRFVLPKNKRWHPLILCSISLLILVFLMFLFLSLLLSQLHFWLSFLFVLKNHTYITTQFLASTPKLWDEWCWSNLAVSHKPTISGFCSSQNHTSCSEGVKLAANFVSSHSWRWYTQCSPPFPTFVRLCCRLGVLMHWPLNLHFCRA